MKSRAFELKPHEEILETVRTSLVPSLPRFLLFIFWILVPFFFLFPLFREGVGGVIVFFGLLISGMVLFLREYTRWSGTQLIITDKRIVDIDRRGFFDRVVTEATYRQIDEASYRVKGFFATVFRYGTIRLLLNGSSADIEFARVFRPSRVHNLINDLREEHNAVATNDVI
ncbi:PH domain-containing protein [Candidatus Uhrbacteria bacterium]|nr:PH domain-containing protein [Candidatus Uhrbacteria bacterium]